MKQPQPLKEIVSVTEMARMCRLSRARFYQLIREGIFPRPSRNQKTGRPYFNREQQERCLQIRRTGRGANDEVVMFYGCRPEVALPPPRKRKGSPNRKPPARHEQGDALVRDLRHGLFQLGVLRATDADIRQAVSTTYPDGHEGVKRPDLLMSVYGELQRRLSADNLRG